MHTLSTLVPYPHMFYSFCVMVQTSNLSCVLPRCCQRLQAVLKLNIMQLVTPGVNHFSLMVNDVQN